MSDAAKPIEAGLSAAQLRYKKIMENENAERATKLMKRTMQNRRIGLGLGCFVLAVYGYTINSVKQETFLDSLDD